MVRFMAPPTPRRSSPIRQRLIDFLERQTGEEFGHDLNRWYQWMWRLPDELHPDYGPFKGILYGGRVDGAHDELLSAGSSSDDSTR